MSETSFPKLHALIIGINKYKVSQLQGVNLDLRGCVGDARSMLAYLRYDLQVPPEQIVCLFDHEATRDNIISAFSVHLIQNPKIKPSDPIVIYYAGHGSRYEAPPEWGAHDGQMETIWPHDLGTLDAKGQYIYGIPDRTLGTMIYSLCLAKGDNITVILDCCHSGSGTRTNTRVRYASDRNAPKVPSTLDEQMLRALLLQYPTQLQQSVVAAPKQFSRKLLAPSLDTHTLLAACHQDEVAQEEDNKDPKTGEFLDPPRRGVFTSVLLKELRECDPSTTSYSTLIRNILASRRKFSNPKLAPQTPQCEGRNQDRLLFSTQFSASKGKIALMPTTSKGMFRIRSGSALGIVVGTEFAVFSESMGPTAAPIAQLVAKDVGPTGALLSGPEPNLPLEIPTDAYVTVIKYNDHFRGVRVLVNERSKLLEPWQDVLHDLESALPIIWTKPGETSDLILTPTNNGIELQRNFLALEQSGPANINLGNDLGAKALFNILTAIVHFHFHLQLQNPKAPVQAHLRMVLQALVRRYDKLGAPQYVPGGEDLFGECLSQGTVAKLRADPDRVFGMTLINISKEDLFPYVLYYDLEDYSISCLYEPPSRSSKAPLAAGSLLPVGYGSTGAHPLQVDFTNPSSEKEYGAFVLLVFSEWVDISYLQQESPFEDEKNAYGSRGTRSKKSDTSVWDKVIVRVEVGR